MKILPWTVGLLLASASAVVAQISVEVVMDQEQFLREESLPVKVRITNRSGQKLHLGRDNDWLTFSIETTEGGIVSRLADVPVLGEFALDSAQVATRQVDLTPCYDLTQAGRYKVTATVRVKDWSEEIASKAKHFEIVRGTKLWEQEFGIPRPSGAPEVRRFVLQQASYRQQLKLYVRLTDVNETKVFKVFPIGPLVSFSHPEAQIDRSSYLHVLFQTGPRAFLFQVLGPDGDVVIRQTYDYSPARPVLRSSEDGRIFVAGGTRRITAHDLPVPEGIGQTPPSARDIPAPAESSPKARSKEDAKGVRK